MIEMIKQILALILFPLFVFLLAYLIGGFLLNVYDYTKWSENQRILLSITYPIAFISVLVYFHKKDN